MTKKIKIAKYKDGGAICFINKTRSRDDNISHADHIIYAMYIMIGSGYDDVANIRSYSHRVRQIIAQRFVINIRFFVFRISIRFSEKIVLLFFAIISCPSRAWATLFFANIMTIIILSILFSFIYLFFCFINIITILITIIILIYRTALSAKYIL